VEWNGYYDPKIGRFISKDPIGLQGGLNFHAYAPNPVEWVDPRGLQVYPSLDIFYPGTSVIETEKHIVTNNIPEEQADKMRKEAYQTTRDPIIEKGTFPAINDFLRNYQDMRDANTIGGDKYFHCKANCEATKRGSSAKWMACKISNLREIVDQRIKGDPKSASQDDQVANTHGRTKAFSQQSCNQVCAKFRPKGLPSKY
jgi:uncharacterized protein RhaS with RHS repeats